MYLSQVFAPEMWKGKLCGLCGDCGSNMFKLRNGTEMDVAKEWDRRWDTFIMASLAEDWAVPDPEAEEEK